MIRRITVVGILVLAIAALVASTAGASPRDEQYGNPLGSGATTTSRTIESPSAVRTTSNSSGALPFTGLEIGLVLAGGGAAAGAGLVLRRIARGRRS